MTCRFLVVANLALLLVGSAPGRSTTKNTCTPTYALMDTLRVESGSWEISFKLLVVGCEERLHKVWPPKKEALEKELTAELQEPHPVQTLLSIRDRSPELRQRLVRRINKIVGKSVVQDVFLFEAKASE